MKLPSRSIRLKNDVKPLGLMSITYIRGFSEKFKRISNLYNIKTVFKSWHSLRNSLMRTRPTSAIQETSNYIYNIFYECGRSYEYVGKQADRGPRDSGNTAKKLEVGHLEGFRPAQHSFEENRGVLWKEAKILETNESSVQEMQGSGVCGMFTKSYQPAQRRNYSHLAPFF
jgi:hypothetical protein